MYPSVLFSGLSVSTAIEHDIPDQRHPCHWTEADRRLSTDRAYSHLGGCCSYVQHLCCGYPGQHALQDEPWENPNQL